MNKGMTVISGLLIMAAWMFVGCASAPRAFQAEVPQVVAHEPPPAWVDQPSTIMVDGTIRVVGHSDAYLQSDSTRKAAELAGRRGIASVIGGSHLWAETMNWVRDHPEIDESAKELGLGEKFLLDVTYDITNVQITSVMTTQCWFDRYGQRGSPNGVSCEVIAPTETALSAVVEAKALGLKRRLAERVQKGVISDEVESKARKSRAAYDGPSS